MPHDIIKQILEFYSKSMYIEVLELVQTNLEKIDDIKTQKELILYSSKSNYSLGNNKNAYHDILTVIEMIQEEEFSPKEIIEIYTDYGKILRRMGEKETALQIYFKILEEYQDFFDNSIHTSILHNLANIYLELGDFARSEDYFQKILKIDKENNDEKGLALTYAGLASLNFYSGKLEKAVDFYTKSLALRVKFDDTLGIATISLNLGSIYANQIKEKEALKYLREAEKAFQKLEHFKGLFTVKNTRARMFYFLKKYKEIIKNLEYLESIDESELNQSQCELTNLLAESLIFENQLRRAEIIVQKGIKKISDFDFSENKDLYSIFGRMKQLLSQIKFKQGNYIDALIILDELEKTSEELKDEQSLISIYFSKAKIHTEEGYIEKALLFTNKAKDLAEKYRDASLPLILDKLVILNFYSGKYNSCFKLLNKLEKISGVKNPYNILKRSIEIIIDKKTTSKFEETFAQMNQESQIIYTLQYLLESIAREKLSYANLKEKLEVIRLNTDNSYQYIFPYFIIVMILATINKEETSLFEEIEIPTSEIASLYFRILSKQILSEELRGKIDSFKKKENIEFNTLLIILDILFFSVVFNLHSIEVFTNIDRSIYTKKKNKELIKLKQEAYKQVLMQESLMNSKFSKYKNLNQFQNMFKFLITKFSVKDDLNIQKNRFMIVLIIDLIVRTLALVEEL